MSASPHYRLILLSLVLLRFIVVASCSWLVGRISVSLWTHAAGRSGCECVLCRVVLWLILRSNC
jgi:hypothetical protein